MTATCEICRRDDVQQAFVICNAVGSEALALPVGSILDEATPLSLGAIQARQCESHLDCRRAAERQCIAESIYAEGLHQHDTGNGSDEATDEWPCHENGRHLERRLAFAPQSHGVVFAEEGGEPGRA